MRSDPSRLAEHVTSCRICAGNCGLIVTVDAHGQPLAARGDRANPLTRGYACVKGVQLPAAHTSPHRLLHPLKRAPDGHFDQVPLEQALDEVAAHLQRLVQRDGPDAVAAFRGTMNYTNQAAYAMLPAWLEALGSGGFYSTMTIDQSAKWVAHERLGAWGAARDPFAISDVMLVIGSNPLVSLSTFGFPSQHPVFHLREAQARGLQLIVADPRLTETARHAQVFLQLVPGTDALLLAGLMHIIIARRWHDAAFCARHTRDFATLAKALESFTPERVAAGCGVPLDALLQAAERFARPHADGRRKCGIASSGTGANMGPQSNLVEHLVGCLNVICGRFTREGDTIANPGVLNPARGQRAQAMAPSRAWERSAPTRSGFATLFGQRMSGALADDILMPGPGRVRALFVSGGNPALTMPDSTRFGAALDDLELLVTIDPFLTATARRSHYVFAPTMMLERPDLGSRDYEPYILQVPYSQFAQPVAAPPQGAEVVDDWFVFWSLAARLGRSIVFDGVPLDMQQAPTHESLLAILARHAAVSWDALQSCQEGRIHDLPRGTVAAGETGPAEGFALLPADVAEELQALLADPPPAAGGEWPFRLAVRRTRDVQNSMYRALPEIRRRMPANPLWMHPDDMARQGLVDGGRVRVESAHGALEAAVEADATLRVGVVSLCHGWGEVESAGADRSGGSNVNLLTSTRHGRQAINAMPQLTGLPVRVFAAEPPATQ